jgi:hypothetical protein
MEGTPNLTGPFNMNSYGCTSCLTSFTFQLIENLTPAFEENRFQASKASENRQKNRHNNILAGIFVERKITLYEIYCTKNQC